MSRYNILQAIVMSFYSKDLYRDVARSWGAKVFLYLLLIVALSWIPMTIQIQTALNLFYQENSDVYISQIPVLTIKDGKVHTPEARPYLIQNPDTKETIAVIDTTGTYTTLEQAKTGMLLTETQLISQPKPNEVRTYQIPANSNMTVDPKVVDSYVKKFLGFVWIFFFIIFVLGAYIYRIIQALIYAVIGLIFKGITHAPLVYDEILRIAIVALTPAIALSTIFDFFMVSYPFQLTSYFLLSMIYLFYGTVANKNGSTIPPEKQIISKGENEQKTTGSQT